MTSKQFLRLATWVLGCVLLLEIAGCNRSTEVGSGPVSTEQHGHHGGHTVKMSDDAGLQMEFTLDEKRRRMVIYVQASDYHNPPHALAVDKLIAKFQADGRSTDVTLAADPLPKDPQGLSSRFAISLDKLPQQLLASNQFLLTLSYSDDGRIITGSIRHSNDHTHNYHHE